ncbi:uncharacterized protein FFMR_09140 [Fusarium fujikuroi]|nr:uncharacterized protein FFMR_09140 [Fusarium fujikuroi]
MIYCTLCGIHITAQTGETWLQEFRAIWVESDLVDHVAVSGVGRRSNNDDEFFGTAPDDPKKRYDDDTGPGTTIDVALTPSRPTIFTRSLDEDVSAWGYGFHASCWSIFTKYSTPNLGHLFAACLSMPTGQEAFLNWGHDYGGASILEKGFEVPTQDTRFPDPRTIPNPFRSDPFHIPALANAIQQTARLQNDIFLSHVTFNTKALTKDPFFRLSPDILQLITVLLSTSEIHAIRLASPVFASLQLTERFWASRFQPGHEFEYIPEVIDHPPESWRAFYSSLQIWALNDPHMANRKRIWSLAKTVHGLVSQMEDIPCQGRPLQTWFETSADLDDTSACWHTAACASTQPNDSFLNGNRVLRARILSFSPTLMMHRMSVSFVNLPEGVFVSGLVLINHSHERYVIGYIHEGNMVDIHLPNAQHIQGWELALHTSGVKAMALIYEDGVLSSWAGDPAGTPRWRLAGAPGLLAIKAEFDAIKLVKLSRQGSLDELSWRNNCLWYPQVPPMGLLYDWNRGDKPPSEFKLPFTGVFFGEADDMYSSTLTEIVVWIFDVCYISGMEFRFANPSHNRQLGNTGPFDEEFPGRRNFSDSHDSNVSLIIDGGAGERLKSLEVQERGATVVGMKINTTFNRHVQTPGYPYGIQKGWVTVQPKGSRIVGMFATCRRGLLGDGFNIACGASSVQLMEEEGMQRIQHPRTGGSCPVRGNANESFDLNQRANCSEVDRCHHRAALPCVFSMVDLDLDRSRRIGNAQQGESEFKLRISGQRSSLPACLIVW